MMPITPCVRRKKGIRTTKIASTGGSFAFQIGKNCKITITEIIIIKIIDKLLDKTL